MGDKGSRQSAGGGKEGANATALPWTDARPNASATQAASAIRVAELQRPMTTINSPSHIVNRMKTEIPTVVAPPREKRLWTPSPMIHRIDPYGSTVAARSVARHHALEIETAHDEALEESARVMAAMAQAPLATRRATMTEFDATARLIKRHFAPRAVDLISVLYGDAERRRSDPTISGVAMRVDPGHLTDAGVGLFGMLYARCTAMRFTRGGIAAAWHPLPCSWHQHAAERALERGAVQGNVHLAIGREITRLSPLIAAVADHLRGIDVDCQLPIPFAGGLLMGAIDVEQSDVATANNMAALVHNRRDTTFANYDAQRSWSSLLGLRRKTAWTAWTFYGEDMLTPAQIAWRDEWEAITDEIDDNLTPTISAKILITLIDNYDDTKPTLDRAAIERDLAEAGPRQGTDWKRITTSLKAAADKAYASGAITRRARDRHTLASQPLRSRDHDDDPILRGIAMAARRSR